MNPQDAPTKAALFKTFQTASQIFHARFTACGTALVAACMDSTVRRWRFVDPPPEAAAPAVPDAKPQPKAAAKGKAVAPQDLVELAPIQGFQSWVQTLATHPSASAVYAADAWGRLGAWDALAEGTAPLWCIDHAHEGWIRQLAVSPKGDLLASCGRDQYVRIWDTRDGRKIAELKHAQDVYCLAFSPEGAQVVFGDFSCAIHVADAGLRRIERKLDASPLYLLSRMQEVTGLRVLRFSPDGATLIAAGCKPASGGFVKGTPNALLFDYASGKVGEVTVVGGESEGFFLDLGWHPAGFFAGALSGQPGSGQLVFFKPGEKGPFFADKSVANCQSIALHPGGRFLAVIGTNKGSNGNGRPAKGAPYLPNNSPIHLYSMEA
jgi:hypothetical protein